MTDIQEKEMEKINNMSHVEMCRLWRFAPAGHPYFDSYTPYYKVFRDRFFNHFGGFNTKISKNIGFSE